MSKFTSDGKILDTVAVTGSNAYTSDDVQVYNPNRRSDAHTSLWVLSTMGGTLEIDIQLEQNGTWYPLVASDAITANTLYNKELTNIFYAVRVIYTNGSGSGVVNAWVFSI